MTITVAKSDALKVEAIRSKMVKTPASLRSVLGESATLTLTDGQSEVEVSLDDLEVVQCVNANRILRVYFVHLGKRASFNLQVPGWHEECTAASVSMMSTSREHIFSEAAKLASV